MVPSHVVPPADIDFADDADAMEVAAALAAAKRAAAAAAAAGRNPGHATSAVGSARGGAHGGGGGGGGQHAVGTDAFLSAMLKAEQAHERKAAAGGAQGGGDELQRLMAQKGKAPQVGIWLELHARRDSFWAEQQSARRRAEHGGRVLAWGVRGLLRDAGCSGA